MRFLRIILFSLISSISFAQTAGFVAATVSGANVGGAAAAPSTQATSITFSSVIDVSMTISFTAGSGNARLVLIKAGSAITGTPTNGLAYESNTIYGAGDLITDGYVVFAGSGTSVTVTGLTIGTTYHVRVFEYNVPSFNYLTITGTGNPNNQITSTEPSIQAQDISFTNILDTQVTIAWTNGNGTNRLVIARATSSISTDPSDNTTYTANSIYGSGTAIGSGYTVYKGSGNSATITGLTLGVVYYFRVYEFGGSTGTENFITATANSNPNSQAIDYLGTTLIDEWISNSGLKLKTGTGTYLSEWTGYRNGFVLKNSGNTPKPVSGILPLNDTAEPGFVNTALNINGDVVLCFLIQKTAISSGRTNLFTSGSGDSPSFRIDLETSGSNSHMSATIAGTTYNSGVDFTYDANFHALAFVIAPSTTSFKVFMDGAQVGTTQTIPGTAINMTSSTTKTLFGLSFVGQVKKLRVYNATITDVILAAVTNTANPFYTTMAPHRNARVYGAWGQSNMVGSTLVASDMPSYLQASMPNAYVFETFDRYHVLAGTHPTTCGPDIKAIYDLSANYPNDDIFYLKVASANRSLAVDFRPTTPLGTMYTNLSDGYQRMVNTLLAENRTITERSLMGMQGEKDSDDNSQATAYQTNFQDFNSNIRTATGLTNHAFGRIHSHLPSVSQPYSATVRTAQATVAGADADADYIDTDDNTTGNYELRSDNIHFNAVGAVKLGQALAAQLISMYP